MKREKKRTEKRMMRFGDASSFFVRSGKSVILLFRFLPHLQVRSLPSCLLCGMEPVCSYNIFCCLKCIAGIFGRNSFYFFEGTISFFLIDDIAGCSGNLFPGKGLFSFEGFKLCGRTEQIRFHSHCFGSWTVNITGGCFFACTDHVRIFISDSDLCVFV